MQLMDDTDKEVLLSEARHSGLRWVYTSAHCVLSPAGMHLVKMHIVAAEYFEYSSFFSPESLS